MGNEESAQKDKKRSASQDWNADIPRLVLYADFMGFKNRTLSKEHEALKEELEKFHDRFSKKVSPLQKGDYLKIVQFSDTILIVVNGVDDKMVNLLTKAAVVLFHISMDTGIPIKAVIAQGTFTYDKAKELYFGKPLIDAYLLHEEIKYYGIVVHHTAEPIIKKCADVLEFYSNSPIYLERGKVKHYHLCWNLMKENLSSGDITDKCKEWLDAISETVSGFPRLYVDRTVEILEEDSKLRGQ